MSKSNLLFIGYNWATVMVWLGLILFISSITDLDTTGGVSDWVIRSLGYAILYGGLFLLVLRASLSTIRMKVTRLMYWKSKQEHAEDIEFARLVEFLIFFVSILVCLLIAASDEYYQSFVTGRVADITDVLVNLLGMAFASIAVYKFPILTEAEARVYNNKTAISKRSN